MTAHEITGFFDWLRSRDSGFEAGDQQYLMADDLIRLLAARNEWPSRMDEWRLLLGPVFCSSPVQQDQFYKHFNQRFFPEGSLQEGGTKTLTEVPGYSSGPVTSRWRKLRFALLYLVISLLIGWLIVALVESAMSSRRQQVVSADGQGKPTGHEEDSRGVFGRYVRMPSVMATGGALILGVVFFLARIYWRRRLELRKWTTPVEPRMRRLGLSLGNVPLFSGADVRKIAIGLRRRRSQDSTEIDADRTVEASARNGGYFTPTMAKRNIEPEYLWLGERKNLRDHKARLDDELISRLRDHDVVVQRYYFQSDPRICSDAKGNIFTLSELTASHPHHELCLQLDASRCVDPVSSQPERWWNTIHFWQFRVLFSFEPPDTSLETPWAYPTLRGLGSLTTDQPQRQESYGTCPSAIKSRPEFWLRRAEPAPAAITQLIAQLRSYLRRDGFLLLQATAVYPSIAWNITVTLAGELLPQMSMEPILNRLAILPWFRHGMMPDWLRIRLVSRLGEHEQRVRKALYKYISSSTATVREKEEALDIVPSRRPFQEAEGQLQDYVYLSFVKGRRLDQLGVEAPEDWNQYVRQSLRERLGALSEAVISTWNVCRNRLVPFLRWVQTKSENAIDVLRSRWASLASSRKNGRGEMPKMSDTEESRFPPEEIEWGSSKSYSQALYSRPRLSNWQRVTGMLREPSLTFEDIKAGNRSWWLPFFIISLTGYMFFAALYLKIGMQTVAENQIHTNPTIEARLANLTPEQRARELATTLLVTEIGYLAAPLASLIYSAIGSMILWPTIIFIFGGKTTYRGVFAAWMFASLPTAVKSLLGIAVIFGGVAPESFNGQNIAPTNLGYFLSADQIGKVGYSLATSLDISTLWSVVLMGIGLSVMAGVKRWRGFTAVFGWWAVLILIVVALAASF